MILKKCALMRMAASWLLILVSERAEAASWWYEQAERLQLVSAALLDGAPISEPVPQSAFIEGRLLTSLLPKPNPTVGAKKEKVPAAPLHTVPTLVGGMPVATSGRYSLVTTAWAGYLPLPQSMAKTMGVNASLNQYLLGASAENVIRLPKMLLTTSIGGQYGGVSLKGGITAEEAKDTFDATLSTVYLSQGVQGRTIPLWANGMILFRRGKSTFNITAEKTEFTRADTMSDAPVPLSAQVTIGVTLKKSLHLAISEYMVPNRLIMPRVSVAYQYVFNDKSAQSNQDAKAIPAIDEPTPQKLQRIRRKKR